MIRPERCELCVSSIWETLTIRLNNLCRFHSNLQNWPDRTTFRIICNVTGPAAAAQQISTAYSLSICADAIQVNDKLDVLCACSPVGISTTRCFGHASLTLHAFHCDASNVVEEQKLFNSQWLLRWCVANSGRFSYVALLALRPAGKKCAKQSANPIKSNNERCSTYCPFPRLAKCQEFDGTFLLTSNERELRHHLTRFECQSHVWITKWTQFKHCGANRLS